MLRPTRPMSADVPPPSGGIQPRIRRGPVLLAVAMMIGFAIPPLGAQRSGAQRSEAELKAGFLLGFPAYVRWPKTALPEPTSPLIITVVGSEEVAEKVEELLAASNVRDRRETGRRRDPKPRRPVELVSVPAERALGAREALTRSHIIYVGAELGTDGAASILAVVDGSPVLTITDRTGSSLRPAIELFLENSRMRFAVRLGRLSHQGLEASSRMLRLGEIIDEDAEAETAPPDPPSPPETPAEEPPPPERRSGDE